jgi:microcystin degradation protein MlrC
MPRILIGECKQEVSTFNPVPSRYGDFIIRQGEEIVAFHQELNTEMTGALEVFAARPDVEVVPAYSALSITSAGTLGQGDFERIADEFSAAIQSAQPVDGVYLSLHGAMAAEEEDDPEGYLLEATREVVGPNVPMVISMDLHGIPTDRMLRNCDALAAFHTYPHVDFADTGARAARLLLRILDGEVDPVMAFVTVPALVRGDELVTATGLFGQVIRAAQALEAEPEGLAAGMFIGNPFTDVPELQSYSFVIRDADAERAAAQATELAQRFWSVRQKLQATLVPVEKAIEVTERAKGTVILVDAADATSSGASGDSNVILRALIGRGYGGRVLAPIVDAEAVAAAIEAGVGNTVATTIGGKLDTKRFRPMPITATVHMLSQGKFASESNGAVWHSGPTAVLQSGNYTIVATSRSVNLVDRSLFYAHGQDPKQFNAVIVKSPHCQPHMFDEWAEVTINVDAPGSTSADLHSLGHVKCPRPIFPLDQDMGYTPDARIYRRGKEPE